MKPLEQDTQRLWDLVRYQRSALHCAELITDDEYARLAEDHGAVARLEEYDKQKPVTETRERYSGNFS